MQRDAVGDSFGADGTESAGLEPRRRRRRARARLPDGASSVVRTAFAALVVASVLAVGAVHVEAQVPIAVAGVAIAVAVLRSGVRIPAPAILLAAAGLWSAMQSVPLPMRLLNAVAPSATQIWQRAPFPFGEAAPALASLSLDPGASLVAAMNHWTYACVFIVASAIGAKGGGRWGAILALASAALVAIVTIAHGLADATSLYGLYAPRSGATGWRAGPLINPNNLAGYLNMGVLAGVGLLAGGSARLLPRWLLALSVALILGVSMLTGSRGGIGALIVGVLLLVVLLRGVRREHPEAVLVSRREFLAFCGLALGSGLVFAWAGATGHTVALISDDNIEKVRLASFVLPMTSDNPIFGIGRGAFESVFPAYKMGVGNLVYSHPENFLVQWVVEWGVPASCMILVAMVWFARPRYWGADRGTSEAGIYAAFVALLLQNLVDFSLEVPGVAVTACATMGIAWGASAHTRDRGASPVEGRFQLTPLARVLLVGVIGGVLVALSIRSGRHTLTVDRDLIRSEFPRPGAEAAERRHFLKVLEVAALRHPADPYFYRTGALFEWSRKGNPMPFIQVALERAMSSGRTHFLLAGVLATQGAVGQALLELRLAATQDPGLVRRAAALAVQVTKDPQQLLRAVPDGSAGVRMLVALAKLLPADAAEGERLLEEAATRDPSAVEPRSALAERLIRALRDPKGALCAGAARAGCQRRAAALVDAVFALRPDADDSVRLRTDLLLATGRAAEATAWLADWCPRIEPRTKCLRSWLLSASTARDHASVEQAARAVELDGCTGSRRCADVLTWMGETLAATGNPIAAITFYERAAREEPTAARWRRVAAGARNAGAHGEAVRALEKSTATRPDSALDVELDQERARAFRETLLPTPSNSPAGTGTNAPERRSDSSPEHKAATTRHPSTTSVTGRRR